MKKLIPFLCVFAYFMSPYRLGGHEMPEIMGILSLLFVIMNRPSVSFDKRYMFYMSYMWVIPPLCALECGIPGNYLVAVIPVALILTSCYLCILLPSVDKGRVLYYYRMLVYVAVSFFIIQELSVALLGYRPTMYIPFLEMYYKGSDAASFAASRAEMERSSSFFLEPSHFAQYILPYFCIILSKYVSSRKGLFEVLFMTAIILILRAGIGYVTLLTIGSFFFIKSDYLKLYQRIIIVLAGFLGFLFLTTVYANTEFVSDILDRTSEFSMEVNAHGKQSGFIRIWRGYFIYGAMDLINQIFGVGISGLEYVCNAIFIPGCRYEGTYMNGIQSLLVTGGLVGCCLFLNFIFSLIKKLDITGQCILVAMLTIFFMEHMLYTQKMFLYILLACCFVKDIKNNLTLVK